MKLDARTVAITVAVNLAALIVGAYLVRNVPALRRLMSHGDCRCNG
ncbi:MAG: hypothetical protein ACOVPA_14555 [Rubrivivax sp.]